MDSFFINKWAAKKKVKQFYVRVGDAGAKSKSVSFKSVYNKFHTRMGDIKCRLEKYGNLALSSTYCLIFPTNKNR